MKTSIFDMTLTLPPMVEMTQVDKDMPSANTDTNECWSHKCICVVSLFIGRPK